MELMRILLNDEFCEGKVQKLKPSKAPINSQYIIEHTLVNEFNI